MNDPSRQPKILGFAGHRDVSDPEELRKVVREELLDLKEKLGGRVIALSSAAPGADLIFLRACVDLRIPAIVILPFPEEKFSHGFDDPAEWEMAKALIGVALAKYIAPGTEDSSPSFQGVSRNLMEWADAFLFVWDSQGARGTGGTGEAMDEAMAIGLPTRIIHAENLETTWAIPLDQPRKARHGFDTRQDLLDFLDQRYAPE